MSFEVYFSPTDGTTSAIRNTITTTDYDMFFALLSFTRDDLADAIIDETSFFVTPVGAIEQISGTGAEYDFLLEAGVEVYSHQGIPDQLHHKYAVIDQSQPLSDPTVITGSHNWSSTAENTNDENTVIVHDARVSNLYYQEFRGLLVSMGVIGVEDVEGELALAIFPNPTSDILYVEVSEKLIGESLTLVDVNGRNVIQLNVNELRSNIDVSRLESGVYFLSAPSINKTLRVLIQ